MVYAYNIGIATNLSEKEKSAKKHTENICLIGAINHTKFSYT